MGDAKFAAADETRAHSVRFRYTRIYAAGLAILLRFLAFQLIALARGRQWRQQHLPIFQLAMAKTITRLILSVRGMFVKIGQMLSMLTNFLPEEFRTELEAVQDCVPPTPFAEMAKILEQNLADSGQTLAQCYAHIEPRPIAAASLAQVHRARLHDGREVAVKIQHPGIAKLAKRDLRTLKHLLWIGGLVSGLRGLMGVHKQVCAMIEEELDFTREGQNLQALAACFSGQPEVIFPQFFASLSGKTALTVSYEWGIKISDTAALAEAGIDRRELANSLLDTFCQMIFKHGLYHADPHSGNLLVKPDGKVVFLDFGAVSSVSPEMRAGIRHFLQGLIAGNAQAMHVAMDRMGFITKGDGGAVSEEIVAYFQRRFLEQINLSSFRLEDIQADFQTKLDTIADFRHMGLSMRQVTRAFQVPKSWILLNRTLMLLLGLVTHLDPKLNPMTVIRPFIEREILGENRNWAQFVTATLKNTVLGTIGFFNQSRELIRKLEEGRLVVRSQPSRLARQATHKHIRLVVSAAMAAVAGVLCYHAWQHGADAAFKLSAAIGSVFLGLTFWNMLKNS